MPSPVAAVPAADPREALVHFEARLRVETDCADVHAALQQEPDFVLFDVRGPRSFAEAHVRGAINLPHVEMTAARLAAWPSDTLFVVYCAGPHCNGANKAAVRLAGLGLRVKEMIGGMTGWADEGFAVAQGADSMREAG